MKMVYLAVRSSEGSRTSKGLTLSPDVGSGLVCAPGPGPSLRPEAGLPVQPFHLLSWIFLPARHSHPCSSFTARLSPHLPTSQTMP